MLASVRDANASGAARRRQRRLRQWLRHERLSVAMALAEMSHHTAPRGQKTARAGEEDHEMHYTATVRTHPPPQVAGTEYFELSDEDVVPARGSRPPCLGEPRGPQERDLPRTVEQIAVYAPMVQILDAPVPQLVEQLPDVLRFFDLLLPVPEQVIEVPKILLDDVPARTVVRDTQLVEQLVEVPTIVSFSSLQQRTVEQIFDIPVPGRGGGGGRRGLQSLLPGQNTTAQSAQIVDIPVPRDQDFLIPVPGRGGGGGRRGLHSLLPGQDTTAHSAQIVDIPVPRGQDFLPRQGSTAFFAAHQPAVQFVAPAPVASCRAAGSGGGLQNFVPGQSSTAVFRDGGPGGGVQNFVSGQSSDDDDELLRRSNELLEYGRREYGYYSEEEEVEEEEEETEQMDLEEQPSRFEGHFRPRRFCAFILSGGYCWRGSSCTFAHSYDELHPDVQGLL